MMIAVMDAQKSLNPLEGHCLDFQNVTIPSGKDVLAITCGNTLYVLHS